MRKLLVVLALVLLPLAPVRAQFCPGVAPWVFVDVPASHAFCTYVTWMAQNNVTLGCRVIDANNREYCPDDSVSRLQMAAFMNRLGDALFPLTCAAGQVMKWNGLAWVCADDATSGGAPNAFVFGGNAFGTTAVLGTTDVRPLDIRVNNSRVMRYEPNSISPNVIGGGPGNSVTAGVRGATIAGGGVPAGLTDPDFLGEAPNRVTDAYGTVGGGFANRAGDDAGTTIDRAFATVGGGFDNVASGEHSTVAGGTMGDASGRYSTVAGGYHNIASGFSAVASGGGINTASGSRSAVGGGSSNRASAIWATVSGGDQNLATGNAATVSGGMLNSASDVWSTVSGGYQNNASGLVSTVSGGHRNVASGAYSWAGGLRARTESTSTPPIPHPGAFVWADSNDLDFNSNGANEFAARATGGVRFVTAVDVSGVSTWTCGASGGAGGSWGCSSDRSLKTDLVPLDGRSTLAQLVELPVYNWIARDDARRIPHAGPTAQDFMAAFGLGDNDKMIGFADAQGVLFSAVQGLNAKLEARVAAKDAEIAALKREMADHRATYQRELADLRLAVEVLIAQTSPERRVAQTR